MQPSREMDVISKYQDSEIIHGRYISILIYNCLWHAPNSLKDSNVNPKFKTTEEQGVGAVPWLVALRGVDGHAKAPRWD
jgi:hypothetical protein